MVQITDRSQDALCNGPERISVAWLKQFTEFHDFHTQKPKPVTDALQPAADNIEEATPYEQLASAHQSLMENLADEVLDSIRKASGSPAAGGSRAARMENPPHLVYGLVQ